MKRKKDIKKKNEETHKHRKETRERGKANSIVVVLVLIVIVTIVMALLTRLSIHIQVIIRGGIHIFETVILLNVAINRLAITDVI
jgi:hypothetical protein